MAAGVRGVTEAAEAAAAPTALPHIGGGGPAGRGVLDITFEGTRLMVWRNLTVFLQTWKVNFLPPLVEPFLYLLAIGYGLGALVGTVGDIPYVQFIAPAIITITMMQSAFFETTYSSYVRMYYQKTWDAVVATPLSHDDILLGEVLWAALRATINATLMTVVVAGFGLLSWPTALWIPPIAFLVGMVFGGIGLFVTAKVPRIDAFSYAMYLFITPMFLFSGTFFPLSQLPEAARWVAYALPLTHAVNLVRGVALGELSSWSHWSVIYLVGVGLIMPIVAMQATKKRIVA